MSHPYRDNQYVEPPLSEDPPRCMCRTSQELQDCFAPIGGIFHTPECVEWRRRKALEEQPQKKSFWFLRRR